MDSAEFNDFSATNLTGEPQHHSTNTHGSDPWKRSSVAIINYMLEAGNSPAPYRKYEIIIY